MTALLQSFPGELLLLSGALLLALGSLLAGAKVAAFPGIVPRAAVGLLAVSGFALWHSSPVGLRGALAPQPGLALFLGLMIAAVAVTVAAEESPRRIALHLAAAASLAWSMRAADLFAVVLALAIWWLCHRLLMEADPAPVRSLRWESLALALLAVGATLIVGETGSGQLTSIVDAWQIGLTGNPALAEAGALCLLLGLALPLGLVTATATPLVARLAPIAAGLWIAFRLLQTLGPASTTLQWLAPAIAVVVGLWGYGSALFARHWRRAVDRAVVASAGLLLLLAQLGSPFELTLGMAALLLSAVASTADSGSQLAGNANLIRPPAAGSSGRDPAVSSLAGLGHRLTLLVALVGLAGLPPVFGYRLRPALLGHHFGSWLGTLLLLVVFLSLLFVLRWLPTAWRAQTSRPAATSLAAAALLILLGTVPASWLHRGLGLIGELLRTL
ncbi:MAG: hypothetical protein AAF604_00415 [Acidobacteriota bacterium]